LLCCFVAEILGKLYSFSGLTQRILINLKKFSKTPFKQFTPVSFKAIYSNNWHQELGTCKILKFDPKTFFLGLKNYLLGRVPQLKGHLYFVV